MTTSIGDAGVLFADASVQPSAAANQIQTITATVAANALTVGISVGALAFRSVTLTSGTVVTLNATAVSLTVPSTATLGTVNAVQSRLVILALNNAGVVEPAVANLAGGLQLDETNLISTTALSASATSASVIYSTTARTNVAYRVVGFIDITEATAGTWATAASEIQGIGGQALTAMSSLGYGQTWQDLTASRAFATTYTNTTGKPILICITISQTASNNITTATISVNSLLIITVQVQGAATGGENFQLTTLVPSGATYIVPTPVGAGGGSINRWVELR